MNIPPVAITSIPPKGHASFRLIVVLMAASGLASAGVAAGVTWTGATDTNFETGTNWGGTAPANDITTDYGVFTGTPTANQPTLTTSRSIGGLQFGSTGGWTLSGASTLTLGNIQTVGATSGVAINASALSGTDTISVGAINLGTSQTWLVGTGGTLNVNSTVQTNSIGTFRTINFGDASNAGTLVLGGSGADNAYLALTIANGTVQLNKASTSSFHAVGGTTINGGTLQLAGSGGDQIWDGANVAVNGGTFDLNGQSEAISQLQAASAGGTVTNLSGTASTLTIGRNTGGGTYAGAFAGNLSIIVGGGGPGGSTFSGSINNSGTITNTSTGTTALTISGTVGSNVTGLIQNSATSKTILTGNNGSFTGPITIKSGIVEAGTTSSSNSLGTGTITIGDSSNTGAVATLNINPSSALTFNNAISTTGTGLATINLANWHATFTNAITMGGSSNLALTTTNNNNSTLTVSGAIGGTGNLILQIGGTNSGSSIVLSNTVNNAGTITNSGTNTAGASTTISGAIGSNVTQVIQNSANSPLILSSGANAYGQTIVQAGTARTSGSGRFGVGNVTVFNGAILVLGNSASIGDTATLLFGNTATINLNGQTETLAGLFDTDTSTSYTVAGTYTAAQLNAQFGGITAFTGSGSITITSAIPEPSTYGAIFGALAVSGAFWKRRRSAAKAC